MNFKQICIISVSGYCMHCILSNCCNHKCDQSISQIFLCNFWRVFVISNLCGLGNSTFSIIVVDEDETASFILSFQSQSNFGVQMSGFCTKCRCRFSFPRKNCVAIFLKLSKLDVLNPCGCIESLLK